MQKRLRISLKWGIPLVLTGVVVIFRWLPVWAEWYVLNIYPYIACCLSAFSSLFPFSVGDCFILGAVVWVVGYPFYAWKHGKSGGYIGGKIVRVLLWIYVWFYVAWGITYFRQPFYERVGLNRAVYSEEEFQRFLDDYIEGLKESYFAAADKMADDWYVKPQQETAGKRREIISGEVNEGYRKIAGRYGLLTSGRDLYPKYMLWSQKMSGMGILGYMGPFFTEFHLNRELLNVDYPFTFAHELAHRLGVASEAEANLYATLVTTTATEAEIRFSGYFSILGYVMNNARRLLSDEDYRLVAGRIPPEIIGIYKKHISYWRGKYNPAAGKVQNKVYNAYLKSNKVEGGTKNYSEVVGLLMALWESEEDQ